MVVEATVYGPPASQGSKNLRRGSGGKVWMVESDKTLKPWRSQMQAEMLQARGDGEWSWGDWKWAVNVLVEIERPRAHYRTGKYAHLLREGAPYYCSSSKDADKILRAIGDAGSGIWWNDDRQIVTWDIGKFYRGHHINTPCTHVTARPIERPWR